MNGFRVGIDNYGLYPLGLDPIGVLQWAVNHGAEGVAFSGLDELQRRELDCRKLLKIRDFADVHGLYLEWGGGQHIPRNLSNWEKRDLFNHNRTAAQEAQTLGVRIIRSCSGGMMRWNPESIPTQQLLEEMVVALTAQKQMLLDHQVVLAIETHFEFTTFELLRVFDACGAKPGEWLGICLDTMNLLTMLEDPVSATKRVLPWVVSTHIKDGGIISTDTGLKTFTAPFGEGIINFSEIFRLLSSTCKPESEIPGIPSKTGSLPWLSLEDHGGDFDIPIFDPVFRKEFPDLNDAEMEQLVALSELTRQKMDSGKLSVLDRKDWPGVCEERLSGNIQGLKNRF